MAEQRKQQNVEPNAKERLLEAGIDVFGRHGYDTATTRMIAGEASVNIAAIPYYFGGKEGLYKAVISYLVEQINVHSEPVLKAIKTTDFYSDSGRQSAQRLLDELLTKFVYFIIGSAQGPRISRIVLREQMYPSSAYDMIFSGVMAPILNAIAVLVTHITGESPGRKVTFKAMTIMGQVLIFRVARETIVRKLDMEGYSESEVNEIVQVILEQTRTMLNVAGDENL